MLHLGKIVVERSFYSILNRVKFVIKACDRVKVSRYGEDVTRMIYYQELGDREIFLTEHSLDDDNLYVCNDNAFAVINFNKSPFAIFSLYGSYHISLLFDIKRKTFFIGTKKTLNAKFRELFPKESFDNILVVDARSLNDVYKKVQISTLKKLKK